MNNKQKLCLLCEMDGSVININKCLIHRQENEKKTVQTKQWAPEHDFIPKFVEVPISLARKGVTLK